MIWKSIELYTTFPSCSLFIQYTNCGMIRITYSTVQKLQGLSYPGIVCPRFVWSGLVCPGFVCPWFVCPGFVCPGFVASRVCLSRDCLSSVCLSRVCRGQGFVCPGFVCPGFVCPEFCRCVGGICWWKIWIVESERHSTTEQLNSTSTHH
jgi:hypothetical protein